MSTLIPTTTDEAAARIRDLDLMDPGELNRVIADLGGSNVSLDAFFQALLRRELVTRYQVERILKGEQHGYVYGRATVLYQVGAGSFARVYRAVDRFSGTILAVKVLRNRYSNDPARRAAFQREGMTGRLLAHPNIVKIEDVGHENGFSFITMEFVEGQNLREMVRLRGPFDVGRGLDLIRQVATALEYAHSKGVTHRDMKASNVLISSSGVAKLVDFGLAGVAAATDKSLSTAQPRTIDYATLERASGKPNDSAKGDIYFLGTLAYLALAGHSALQESRDRAVRGSPQRFTAVIPLGDAVPSLPREVVNVVAKMMALDPDERFQAAGDVRRAVEALLSQSSAAHAETIPQARPARRQPIAADVAAAPDAGSPPPAVIQPHRQPTVMLVEKSRKSQESLRRFLQNLGYRVLLTESPRRALSRFTTRPLPADCLLISAQELGVEAVEAFNELSTDSFFSEVPAILIASGQQGAMLEAAQFDDRRRLLQIPINSEKMVSLLQILIPSSATGSAVAG